MAYKGLVRPIIEYVSPVWDPSGKTRQDELEMMQNRAARFVTGNYNSETGSMTKVLEQMKRESLKQGRKGTVQAGCFFINPPVMVGRGIGWEGLKFNGPPGDR